MFGAFFVVVFVVSASHIMIPALDGRASLDRGKLALYNVYPKLNDNVDMIETSIPYYRFCLFKNCCTWEDLEGEHAASCYRFKTR